MEDGRYAAISGYFRARDLPSCIYEIPEIYVTKKLQNYKLLKDKLYYKEQIQDGTEHDLLVVKRSKADRVFLKCTNKKKNFIH